MVKLDTGRKGSNVFKSLQFYCKFPVSCFMKQGPAKERKEGNLEHDPVGDPRIMDVSKDWKQSSHSMNVEGLQGRCFKRGKNS